MEIICQDINFICEKEKIEYISLWNEYSFENEMDSEEIINEFLNEGIMGYICTIFLYISRITTIIAILEVERSRENIQGSMMMLNEMEHNTCEAIKDEKVMNYVGEHCIALLELIDTLKKNISQT